MHLPTDPMTILKATGIIFAGGLGLVLGLAGLAWLARKAWEDLSTRRARRDELALLERLNRQRKARRNE